MVGVVVILATPSRAQFVPRRPLDPGPARATPLPPGLADTVGRRLIVKFTDEVEARAREDGSLHSLTGRDLAAVDELARRLDVRFAPLIRLPQLRLRELELRAATRSGRAQPDLGGVHVVVGLPSDAASLEGAGEALRALDAVEFVHVENLGVPPPGDIAPTTPSLTSHQQAYFAPSSGIDAVWAWGQGFRGQGVRLSDCEYGWNAQHEDLNDVDLHLEPGQTIPSQVYENGWDAHGTAVVGQTSAPSNGYGIDGLSPDASIHTYPEWSVEEGLRRVTCITNAIADSAPGDVVLLEMQDFGAGGGFAPAEVNPAVFLVVKLGTDAGVIVVGAAGNGAQDLDGLLYVPYLALGDSGAIVVGAGTADLAHDALGFSTYGSRVNLQGWGQWVFTLGYGDAYTFGGDPNQRYTATFNGTSSASPFVAAACVLVQQAAQQALGQRLGPLEMRSLLVDTGTPQGAGGHIGPLPDVRAAIEALLPPVGSWVDLRGGTAGQAGVPHLVMSGDQTPLSPFAVQLSGAAPGSLALLWVSLASTPADAFGGTVHAFPYSEQLLLTTDGAGGFSALGAWPLGVPAGTNAWWQFLCADASVGWGLTLSNGVRSTAP